MHIKMLSPIAIAFQEELFSGYHKSLLNHLAGIPQIEQSFERRVAEIAAYINVEVDGTFSPEGVDKLLEMLLPRLRAHRENPNPGLIIIH